MSQVDYFKSVDENWVRLSRGGFDVHVSTDGQVFHQAYVAGYNGSTNKFSAKLDYGDDRTGSLSYDHGNVHLDGIVYFPAQTPIDPELVLLPVKRMPMAVATMDDGTMVCLSYDKYTYNPVRMFVGAPQGVLQQVEVTRFSIFRDGGSIIAETAMGKLDLPVEEGPRSGESNLGGTRLVRENGKFDTIEDSDTATISMKSDSGPL